MEREDASLATSCTRKVVIVVDDASSDYCSGFVLKNSSTNGTYVVTSAEFVKGREETIKVRFFNQSELSASVVATWDFFSVLRTSFHCHCEEITVIGDDLTPSRVLVFPPSSSRDLYHIPCFIILESITTFEANPTASSHARYFELVCRYGDKCVDGTSKLSGAAVFNMNGDVVGIVTGDFRPKESGNDESIKLALRGDYIYDSVHKLVPRLMDGE